MNRRKFLVGLGSIMAAPAIVNASSLMPIKVMKPQFPPMAFSIDTYDVRARSVALCGQWIMEITERKEWKIKNGIVVPNRSVEPNPYYALSSVRFPASSI